MNKFILIFVICPIFQLQTLRAEIDELNCNCEYLTVTTTVTTVTTYSCSSTTPEPFSTTNQESFTTTITNSPLPSTSTPTLSTQTQPTTSIANLGDVIRTFHGHSNTVHRVVELPNQRLASSSEDHTIKIWNITTGDCLSTLDVNGRFYNYKLLVALPNGNLAIAKNNIIVIIDLQTGLEVKTLTDSDFSPISDLILLKNGHLACSVGANFDKINIWNPETGVLFRTLLDRSSTTRSNALAELDNGFLVSSSGNRVKIWNPMSATIHRTVNTANSHCFYLSSLADNFFVCSLSSDAKLALIDGDTGVLFKTNVVPNGLPPLGLATLNRKGNFASCLPSSQIKIWTPNLAVVKTITPAICNNYLTALSDGNLAAGDNHLIRLWYTKDIK